MALNPFSSIPIRPNSGNVDASWWNTLRQAGLALDSYFGGLINQAVVNLANNQSTAAAITGLVFDATVVSSVLIEYEIYIQTTGTGATELREVGKLTAISKVIAGTWSLVQGAIAGDESGVQFLISNTGQVSYTSANVTGTASKYLIKYKLNSFGVV